MNFLRKKREPIAMLRIEHQAASPRIHHWTIWLRDGRVLARDFMGPASHGASLDFARKLFGLRPDTWRQIGTHQEVFA